MHRKERYRPIPLIFIIFLRLLNFPRIQGLKNFNQFPNEDEYLTEDPFAIVLFPGHLLVTVFVAYDSIVNFSNTPQTLSGNSYRHFSLLGKTAFVNQNP